MTYHNRLPLDPPELGERMLTKMCGLKIEMYRTADKETGQVHILADYELIGQLKFNDASGCIDGADMPTLKALLSEFVFGAMPEAPAEEEGGVH